MRPRSLLAGIGLVLFAHACAEPERPVAAPPDRAMGKAEIFADASLVPTRAGERARAELAVAGEIAKAIRVLPVVEDFAVDAQTDDAGTWRVVVVARVHGDDDHGATIRDEIIAIVGAIAPIATASVFTIATSAPTEAPPPRDLSVLLVLAVLGLGVSAGVTAERLRGRWSQRRAPPRASR